MPTLAALERRHATLMREVDAAIRPVIDAIDVADLARHNKLYLAYGDDKFRHFVGTERRRYLKVLDLIQRYHPGGTVADLGCFIPYLPLLLARVGYRVKMVDKYELYGPKVHGTLLEFATKAGIELLDLDILNDNLAPLGTSDVVLLMAVVEHLNGSPKLLMERSRSVMKPDGLFVFEVPNVAELYKRIFHLLGRSPHQDYAAYFASEYPWMGHNREMTVAEVRYLLDQSGFRLERLESYDYTSGEFRTWKGKIGLLLKRLLPIPNAGESVLALGRAS
jgi:SAM-dependent methyltransferase